MTDMEAEWVAAGSVGESDTEPGRSEESVDGADKASVVVDADQGSIAVPR